jgi:hypothetical protein
VSATEWSQGADGAEAAQPGVDASETAQPEAEVAEVVEVVDGAEAPAPLEEPVPSAGASVAATGDRAGEGTA